MNFDIISRLDVLNCFIYFLVYFGTKYQKFWTYKVVMCWIVLNRYFDTYFSEKWDKKIIIIIIDFIFRKIFDLYQVIFSKDFKCQNIPIQSNCIHQKHYLVKISSISFSSFSNMQKFHHLLGCLAIGILHFSLFKFQAFFKNNMLDKKGVC